MHDEETNILVSQDFSFCLVLSLCSSGLFRSGLVPYVTVGVVVKRTASLAAKRACLCCAVGMQNTQCFSDLLCGVFVYCNCMMPIVVAICSQPMRDEYLLLLQAVIDMYGQQRTPRTVLRFSFCALDLKVE